MGPVCAHDPPGDETNTGKHRTGSAGFWNPRVVVLDAGSRTFDTHRTLGSAAGGSKTTGVPNRHG